MKKSCPETTPSTRARGERWRTAICDRRDCAGAPWTKPRRGPTAVSTNDTVLVTRIRPYEEGLRLSRDRLRPAWDLLRVHGNMSSIPVRFVRERLLSEVLPTGDVGYDAA